MRTLLRFVTILMVLFLGTSDISLAQPGGPGGPGMGMNPKVNERFKQVRAKILRVDVGLDEESAQKAEKILEEFMEQRQSLKEEMRSYRQSLRNLLMSDSDDQRAFADALEGLMKTQDRLHDLRRQEVESLQPLMTPKQQAKFLGAMKEMRRRAKGQWGRGGPHGSGYGQGGTQGPGGGQGYGGQGAGGW